LETSVGLAAQLALAGALPELDFACGLGTLSLLTGDLVRDSFQVVDGFLPVTTQAPTPDPELLEEFALTGDRLKWWQERLSRVLAL
jgi:O-succinylbenzoate synthase